MRKPRAPAASVPLISVGSIPEVPRPLPRRLVPRFSVGCLRTWQSFAFGFLSWRRGGDMFFPPVGVGRVQT